MSAATGRTFGKIPLKLNVRFEQFKSILRAFPRAIFMPVSDLSTLVVQLCPTVGGLICQETVCGYV